MKRLLALTLGLLLSTSANAVVGTNNTPVVNSSNVIPGNLLPHWKGALTRVRTATGNARILVVGDSTSLGFGSNGTSTGDMKSLSWPVQLSNRIYAAGLYSRADAYMGDGFQGSQNSATFDPRIVFTGTNTLTYPFLGGETRGLASTGDNIAFTPKRPCDTFIAYYWQAYLGATFNQNFDGGTNTAVTVNGANKITSNTITSTLGMHTLNVAKGTSTAYIQGMEAIDSTKPTVSVINAGWYGVQAAAMSGYANGSISSAYIANYFAGYNADLIIIDLGINDWNQGITVSAYQTAMQNLITQAMGVGADVVLVTPIPTTPSAGASYATQQQFVNVIQNLAASNNIGLIDIWTRWEPVTQNPTYYYTDGIHGSAAGYSDEADTVYNALGSPSDSNTENGPYAYSVGASSTLQFNDNYIVSVTATGTTQTLPLNPGTKYQVRIVNAASVATTVAAQSSNTVGGNATYALMAGASATFTWNPKTSNYIIS